MKKPEPVATCIELINMPRIVDRFHEAVEYVIIGQDDNMYEYGGRYLEVRKADIPRLIEQLQQVLK